MGRGRSDVGDRPRRRHLSRKRADGSTGISIRSNVPEPVGPPTFIASVDTMKESRDTDRWRISQPEIAQEVAQMAGLGVNYITVDTHWEYADYAQEWVDAIRGAGMHVWF